MSDERKQKAIKWFQQEIRSLELAPKLNGCEMTDEWKEEIEIFRTALEALKGVQK